MQKNHACEEKWYDQQGIDPTSTKSKADAVSTTPHRLLGSMQVVELKI